jgi:hypothetical protein
MRFLKGFLGTWAGLLLSMSAIATMTGDFTGTIMVNPLGHLVVYGIFAAVGATLTFMFERSGWTWARYGVAGVYTSGTVMTIGVLVVLAAIGPLNTADVFEVTRAILLTALIGLAGGIGYRLFAGEKAE